MQGDPVREKREPHYPLSLVQSAFSAGQFVITSRVRRHMALHDWVEHDVVECIATLSSVDFYKSQAHRMHAGVWLDIYRPIVAGERRYVKLTRELTGEPVRCADVLCRW